VISHRHACIFVHIPKTAGSSLEDAIWPGERSESDLWMGMRGMRNKYQTGALQHLLAWQIREEVGSDVFNRYFKFSIVRNPWDKLASQFCWLRSINPALRQYIGMNATASFTEYLELIQKREHVHWMRQVDFLRDQSGQTMVDFVGRFENIEIDAKKIFTRIGLPDAKLPRSNVSTGREHYRRYYNEKTKELVRFLYREDIETFEYEF
jgi:hypothetical protein